MAGITLRLAIGTSPRLRRNPQSKRVLRLNGLSCHLIGPLYYTHGGDHCISSRGLSHGYDHLLATKERYLEMINDDQFFATTPDPEQAGWAKRGWFSFAKTKQYLQAFESNFRIEEVVAIISPEGLEFRRRHPEKWAKLLKQEHLEQDLLIKGLAVIARKNAD